MLPWVAAATAARGGGEHQHTCPWQAWEVLAPARSYPWKRPAPGHHRAGPAPRNSLPGLGRQGHPGGSGTLAQPHLLHTAVARTKCPPPWGKGGVKIRVNCCGAAERAGWRASSSSSYLLSCLRRRLPRKASTRGVTPTVGRQGAGPTAFRGAESPLSEGIWPSSAPALVGMPRTLPAASALGLHHTWLTPAADFTPWPSSYSLLVYSSRLLSRAGVNLPQQKRERLKFLWPPGHGEWTIPTG